jgi:hypothetical protein
MTPEEKRLASKAAGFAASMAFNDKKREQYIGCLSAGCSSGCLILMPIVLLPGAALLYYFLS